MDIHIDKLPHVVTACCVLYNFFEVHGHSFDEEWLQDHSPLDDCIGIDFPPDDHSYSSNCSRNESTATRNALVEHLSS